MTTPHDAEQSAREALAMAYCGRGDFREATARFRAAVYARAISDAVKCVEGMQRWDMVPLGKSGWERDRETIAHDPEGEYLYRSDVLRRLAALPATPSREGM